MQTRIVMMGWRSLSLLGALVWQVRLAWRLLREPAVPWFLKSVPVVAALYLISPLDIVPDFIPVLGQLDDLGLVWLALRAFVRWCPTTVVDFHHAALAQGAPYRRMPADGDIIDAEFRHENHTR